MAPELWLVYLTTVVLALASVSFFSYYERYLLPLIPGAIVLLLDVSRRVRLSLRAGALGFAVAGIVSVMLMRDYFAWNDVKWDAGRALLDRGVAVELIDGGMEWDGWYLYDRSTAYINMHGLPMTIAPWLYVLDPQYVFAFQPPPVIECCRPCPLTPLYAPAVRITFTSWNVILSPKYPSRHPEHGKGIGPGARDGAHRPAGFRG